MKLQTALFSVVFIAAVGGGGVYADKILNDSNLCSLISERYKSFDSDYGKAFEIGELGLEELRELSMQLGNPQKISGKQELFESIINNYI